MPVAAPVHQYWRASQGQDAVLVKIGVVLPQHFAATARHCPYQEPVRLQQSMDFPQGGLDRRRDMLENIGGQDEIEGSRKLAVGLGKVKPRLPVVVRIPVIELLLQDGRVALLIRHAESANRL